MFTFRSSGGVWDRGHTNRGPPRSWYWLRLNLVVVVAMVVVTCHPCGGASGKNRTGRCFSLWGKVYGGMLVIFSYLYPLDVGGNHAAPCFNCFQWRWAVGDRLLWHVSIYLVWRRARFNGLIDKWHFSNNITHPKQRQASTFFQTNFSVLSTSLAKIILHTSLTWHVTANSGITFHTLSYLIKKNRLS